MEFWGIDVKAKEQHNVQVDDGSIIHLSQATLSADIKKDSETVTVHVQVAEKKLVLGMLSKKTPQLSFDLVFDENFVISHNWNNGSIHLMGYTAESGETVNSDLELSSEDEDEDLPVAKENGQFAVAPPKAAAGKPKEDNKAAKAVAKDETEEEDSSDDDEDDSDDSDDSDESPDEPMVTGDSSSDDESDEDDSDESEDEKPVEVPVSAKKRSAADAKSSPNGKKAKIATPLKAEGKKGAVHPATPHPSKKGAKTPATDKSAAVKTPKSGGSGSDLSCGPCKKTFKSDAALQSHTKAKHSAK